MQTIIDWNSFMTPSLEQVGYFLQLSHVDKVVSTSENINVSRAAQWFDLPVWKPVYPPAGPNKMFEYLEKK